jgi:hypothetical protein
MKILLATALALSSLALTGCAPAAPVLPTVSLNAAEDANNPACAEVGVRLPEKVGELEKRQTDSQSTAAWGNPTTVIYRCGMPEVTVSDLVCVTSEDIDWLIDDSKRPTYRFVTFGRKPAIEVVVDAKQISGVTALEGFAPAISKIPATKRCK